MNKTLLGVTLFLCGSLLLLNWVNAINWSEEFILGLFAFLFGLININHAFSTNNRKMIVLSTVLFLLGIILLIIHRFEILDFRGVAFVSIIFVSGASFIMLFINNTKDKVFLYSGIILICISYITIQYLQPIGIFELTTKIDDFFSIVWPVLLLLFGIILFSSRKK